MYCAVHYIEPFTLPQKLNFYIMNLLWFSSTNCSPSLQEFFTWYLTFFLFLVFFFFFLGDNALHIACQFGHPQVVRMLLSESRINAETINLKGRNPLHVLARYGKENAAAICELFMEFIPDYPWNKPDVDGNTGNVFFFFFSSSSCIDRMLTFFVSHVILNCI